MGTKIERIKTLTVISQLSTVKWMPEPSSFIGTSALPCPLWKLLSSQFTMKVGQCGVVTSNFLPPLENVCMQLSRIPSPSSIGFDTSASPSMPDWRLTGTPVPLACRLLQPARRRWIAKHASSNCGVGTTLAKWKCQDDDRCPRCRVPEDTTHVLRCTAKGANDVWNESVIKLTGYLQKTHTHPGIQESLLTNLHRWYHGAFTLSNFQEDEVNNATTSQSSIG